MKRHGVVICLLISTLAACDPSTAQLTEDLRASLTKEFGIVGEPIIESATPGEGDASDVFMDVTLRILPRTGRMIMRGCL